MFKTAVGHSEDVHSAAAIQEVLDQIQYSLEGQIPQAGIIFCSIDLDHALILSIVRNTFPGIELIGCTTDGELSSVCGFTEDSITMMAFVSDLVEIRAGVGRNAAERGEIAGKEAANSARTGFKQLINQEKFAIILSDPLNAGISDISNGIEAVLGVNFPTIGAAAAAHSKQRKTHQFYNDEVFTDSMVLMVFSGSVLFSCGIKGGHAPMGGKVVVTSVNKNVLYRIGDQTALEYFRRYIGDKYNLFMNYCLAVYEEGKECFYVRSAPFSDPETGSVTLNGQVPEGALVQIGTADRDTVIDSCKESLSQALSAYPGTQPAAALIFSCAGRKMIMGTQIVKENQAIINYLGDTPYCGFYSYGEFGPLEKGERSLFHGTTLVTLLIGSEI